MNKTINESDFFQYMKTNGPKGNRSKRNYISWLRYINDNIEPLNDSITKEIINSIIIRLNETQNERSKYTSDTAISDFKSALNKYLAYSKYISIYSSETNDIFSILNNNINVSQRREIDIRLRQGKYRKNLIKIWGMCAVTKYSKIDLLVASHIKPWNVSAKEEKIDPYNGLLLQPNIDKLFDLGYITFNDSGNIIISKLLIDSDLEYLKISRDMKLFQVFKENLPYLKYHQNNVFMK